MDPLARDEALRLLAEEQVAHIGFISEGSPYVTPMPFVVDEGRIVLFRTTGGKKLEALRLGKKLEALRLEPSVCIEVSDVLGDPQSRRSPATSRSAPCDRGDGRRIHRHDLRSTVHATHPSRAPVMFVRYNTDVPVPLSIVEARIAQTRALSTTRRRPR